MKVALVFIGLLALGFSAPQPRKLFHEHFDDFIEIIINEAEQQLTDLQNEYLEFEEFQKTMEYVQTADFKELVYEMEDLPAFKAVIDFLERDNIDILYFIDIINNALESVPERKVRQLASGNDMTSFVNDAIALFPKDLLAALFDQKMSEDEEFRDAMENLQSDEWLQLVDELFEDETFQNEVQILSDNGIDINVLILEIRAIFGQN